VPVPTGHRSSLSEPIRLSALLVSRVSPTATVTVVTGPIAFVALAAPQVAPRLTRSGAVDLPTSALVAATMLTLPDLVARHASLRPRSRWARSPCASAACTGVAAGAGDEPPLSSGLPGQLSRVARRVK
jgi:hypothetical protein